MCSKLISLKIYSFLTKFLDIFTIFIFLKVIHVLFYFFTALCIFICSFVTLSNMNGKRLTASVLLYNFIGLAVAICGWLWEVLIFLFKEQRFVNRGFFYGPYLPVYGVGAVLLSIFFYHKRISVIVTYAHLKAADYPQYFYHSRIYARLRLLIQRRKKVPSQEGSDLFEKIDPYAENRTGISSCIRIFALSMCGGSLTELTAGWLLWHIFRQKYWDYSGYPLNLSGYICLYSALGFGIFGVLWMKWAGPFLIRTWERLRFPVQILVIGLSDLVFVTDMIFSLMQPNSGQNITFSFLQNF